MAARRPNGRPAERPDAVNNRRSRRRRRGGFIPLTVVIAVIAVLFFVFALFQVSEIEVRGAVMYTPQEVINAAGIEEGDNLFFVSRSDANSRVYSQLAYIDSVDVSRKFPGKIIITIEETGVVASIADSSGNYTLDRNCKVLDRTTQTAGLILVSGITPASPVQGEALTEEGGSTVRAELASAMINEVIRRGMMEQVKEIDVSDSGCAVIRYADRFTVKMGAADEELSLRFDRLQSAVSQLGAGDSGSLDLTIDDKVHYIPD